MESFYKTFRNLYKPGQIQFIYQKFRSSLPLSLPPCGIIGLWREFKRVADSFYDRCGEVTTRFIRTENLVLDPKPIKILSCHIAHCVSRDLAMSRGFALEVKKDYGIYDMYQLTENIKWQIRDGKKVFHLITKEKFHDKPNLQDLKKVLTELVENAVDDNIHIPLLGTGLDKLPRLQVIQMLTEVNSKNKKLILHYNKNNRN
jgi:hypothetical protein